ncbi:short chain dehydrogenase [Xylariomycetidae sp. FL0641]|nr:short chain dehydrogenase [Xylariomycetidae sp. FL0641]
MEPPYPSLTPTWHNDVYPAIAPTNPRMSHAGETVIITGAATRAPAWTGSASTSPVLDEAAVVRDLADKVGAGHVLVHGAAYMNSPAEVVRVDVADYGRAYEVKVKGTVLLAKHLLPKAAPGGALAFPAAMLAGQSGYSTWWRPRRCSCWRRSTAVFRRSGASTPDMLAMDSRSYKVYVDLVTWVTLWLTRPEARFLTGRTVRANWDVEQLKGMEDSIKADPAKLTFSFNGWPFPASIKSV